LSEAEIAARYGVTPDTLVVLFSQRAISLRSRCRRSWPL